MSDERYTATGLLDPDFATGIYEGRGEHRHFHKNYEILLVEAGQVSCFADGVIYSLHPGEGFFLFPLQISGFAVPPGGRVRRIVFCNHLILTIHKSVEGRQAVSPVFTPGRRCVQFVQETLGELFGAEYRQFARLRPYEKRMQVKGLLYLLGSEFLRGATLIPRSKAGNLCMEMVQYIATNYQNDISLQDIAEENGYNYQYLSRKFNRYMGMGFKKMVNLYRVQQAFLLLQDTDQPISQVAYECGFQSIRSFNQVCKEIYGKTPSELRDSREVI